MGVDVRGGGDGVLESEGKNGSESPISPPYSTESPDEMEMLITSAALVSSSTFQQLYKGGEEGGMVKVREGGGQGERGG